MKAVILAAGEGVRLLPITATRPKHMIPVGGKPILEHCLDALKKNNITEALIITHYMGENIRSYFGDGSKLGFSLEYSEQNAILGTGNAARLAEPYVEDEFLLVYGDLLFSPDAIRNLLDVHKSNKSIASMSVVPVDNPESYGIIDITKEGKVKSIVEKPNREKAPSNLANAGLYIFNKDIFGVLKTINRSSRGEWELTDAVTILAKDKSNVSTAQITRGDWIDVGRPWDLIEANVWALKRREHKVLGNVEQGAHILGPVTIASTARIRSGAYIEGPSLIDEGADVGPNCFVRPCTSIGKNARVGNACEVKNSIIMEGTHVGHLSYVGDSVICANCNLGAGTITANLRLDNSSIKMQVKDKMVDTGRRKLGAILGDSVKTGIGTLIMPGVKIGNDSWVKPGSLVNNDMSANLPASNKPTKRRRE